LLLLLRPRASFSAGFAPARHAIDDTQALADE
jgi:hypothetical protein